MEVYGVIYLITNLFNGMKYVGQTTQPLRRRINQHKHGNQYIDREIQKYGWEKFTVEVLEECASREKLDEREIFWIRELNCKKPNGYNINDGGEGCSHSPETIAKLSAMAKEREAKKSPEQKATELKKRTEARTHEERSISAKKGWAAKSPDERSLMAKKREARKTHEQKSMSGKKAAVKRKITMT